MPDCPLVTLPTTWHGLLIGLGYGLLLVLFAVGGTIMVRERRRHTAWMHVYEAMFAEEQPELYARRQARKAEEEARITLYLAQHPTWYQRWRRLVV